MLAGLKSSLREIGHYLWLRGLHDAWKKNPKARIDAEVVGLFQSGDGDLKQLAD